MSVAYELKRKRAELVERFQQIATEQIEIQGLMGALDRVIVSYEPDYQPSPTPGSAKPRAFSKGQVISESLRPEA